MALAVLAGVACGQETGVNARDCVYAIGLNGALEGGKTLTLYLDRQTNAFGMGFGLGRRYNRMPYDVDASGLRVEPGSDAGSTAKVKGPVKMIVHPDGYVPRTDAPVRCAYELDCTVAGSAVRGVFQGTFGSTTVTGDVSGEIRARVAANPAHLNLAMENAIGHAPDA
jgi:hypothetical protein